jgi:hypothetical protein
MGWPTKNVGWYLEKAEERAGLQKLDHVAAAGGWKNTATLLTCYQQPTSDKCVTLQSVDRA